MISTVEYVDKGLQRDGKCFHIKYEILMMAHMQEYLVMNLLRDS